MNLMRFRPALSARIIALVTAVAIVLPALAASRAVAQEYVTVVVDGQSMSFDQPPTVRAGRVFVPLRGVFERLGASVVYADGQINATGRGRTVSLTIGSTHATVDGQPAILDVAPFLVGARTMVPLRFIAQALGATVNWNDGTSTVTIGSRSGGRPNPAQPGNVSFTYQWPTGTIYNHYPQIRFQLNRPIRPSDVSLLVDGREVASGLQNNGQYFFAAMPWSQAMGNHRVRLRGQTAGGIPFDLGWTFYQASY